MSVPCGVSISCGLPAIATTIAHPVAVVAGRQSPRSAAHFVQKYLTVWTIVLNVCQKSTSITTQYSGWNFNARGDFAWLIEMKVVWTLPREQHLQKLLQ